MQRKILFLINLCSHQVIYLAKASVQKSLFNGDQGIWKLVTTFGLNAIFVSSDIVMWFVEKLTLTVTLPESSNGVNVNKILQ